ncbi:phycobilisome linker polypeptide [Pseudanabaena yagii]|uniref:CpcD-like domain-containing protein n=1 Tax=Pseudanabaena yagii GIHE-NHR1 TaxID=2722753 RepID=A0ABX1LK27_9CYAN|nr:phycobilisome linker polypeptide [Pseudanabaena yagii]NMF56467.1 hypothetical protein [Pseudanabaena yagii GIHE-NHR1]
MKSLDIDSVNTGSDDYRSQPVKIEFTGGIQKGRTQGTIQTVTVAYSSLSKKLQSIHRLGGKIINVSIPRFQAENVDTEHIASDISENIPVIAQALEHIVNVAKGIHDQDIPAISQHVIEQVELIDQNEQYYSIDIGCLESNLDVTQDASAIDLEPVEVISKLGTTTEIVSSEIADSETENTAEVASSEVLESIVESETISEVVSEIAPEEISNNLAEPETTSEKIVEATVETATIPEIVSTKIETNEPKSEHIENTSVVTEPKTVSPQKSKPIALTAKPKKSRASAKNHGFNKREPKHTTHEPIVVDVIDSSHHNVALALEKEPEHLIQQVVEINPNVSVEPVEQASVSIADQEVSEQDLIPKLVIETAPILAESVISNMVADVFTETVTESDLENSEPVIETQEIAVEVVAETFIPEALAPNLETAETVVAVADEALAIKVDAVVNEQLQHEEPIPELKESNLEPSQTGITETVEPLVEDIHAIATENISTSIPQVEAATPLAKPKKSKTASKGFNKPKSPNSSTSRSPRN